MNIVITNKQERGVICLDIILLINYIHQNIPQLIKKCIFVKGVLENINDEKVVFLYVCLQYFGTRTR